MTDEHKTSTLRMRCPHCKRETFLKINAPDEAAGQFASDAWLVKLFPDVDEASSENRRTYIVETLSKCPESDCKGPILTVMRWDLNDVALRNHSKGERHYTRILSTMRLLAMYPDGRRPTLDAAIPKNIREEWSAIIELAEHRRSPAIVLVACRAILEAAVRDLEESAVSGGRMVPPSAKLDLQKRIDGLASAGLITHTLKDWAHELRLDGNDGAHELKGDPDRALEFARFVEFFLESTFVMEAKLKRIQRQPMDSVATVAIKEELA